MAIARLARHVKRPFGLCAKMTAVAILGLCFILVWSVFSSSSSAVTFQRESFDDIAEPVPANHRTVNFKSQSKEKKPEKLESSRGHHKVNHGSNLGSTTETGKKIKRTTSIESMQRGEKEKRAKSNLRKLPDPVAKDEDSERESEKEEEEEGIVVDGREEATENDAQIEGNGDSEREEEEGLTETVGQEAAEKAEEEAKSRGKKRKIKGPLFDVKAHYSWRLCSTRSKHNYIPCIDIETGFGRVQSYRHTERSCPRSPPMCLVPLPHESYGIPVPWPESKSKV